MRKSAWLAALVLCATGAFAAENQAYLGIFAETRSQKMAGMPEMPALPPGIDPSMLGRIPGMAQMMGMGGAQRLLTVRLWSPGIAPANATASIAPPAGLKQEKRLDLGLYRPEAEGGEAAAPGEVDPDSIPDFTIKIYWGSSATVKPGQPVVFNWGKLTPEQKAAMREAQKQAQKGESYFYKPDWTTGYWPTGKQPGAVAPDAALAGTYALTTSYTGNVTLDVPAGLNFLAPIELTSPKLSTPPALDGPLALKWKAIPEVLGYHATIMGMQGRNTLILWSSSEIQADMAMQWDYLEMARVRELVQSTAMMDGKRTAATVPAGIFKGCDMAHMTMVGYGPGVARADTQPLPRLQTKTTLTVMLGGSAMAGMGAGE